MRRRALALMGTTGLAAALLASSPAAADETAVPAPSLEEASESLGEQRIDLGGATIAPQATMGGGSIGTFDSTESIGNFAATTTDADGKIVVQDDELPMGYCGGAWTWDIADAGDYRIDLTYGLSADCNFPPAGFPQPDIGTEASLHSHDGQASDFAPSGHGSFGFPAESIATVERSWPSSWHMNAEMSILLVFEDPKQPWVWVDVPPECQGAGTYLLYCQYETETLHIGNTPCGTGNSFSDTGGRMHASLSCSGTVSGSVTDSAADGKCTYAMVALTGGEVKWAGVCDGGGTVPFDWSNDGEVVHAWLYFQ